MSQSKFSLDSASQLRTLSLGFPYDTPSRRRLGGESFEHDFEKLSYLYGELASRVTEIDVLHRLSQVLPDIVPCARLSYVVPHPHDEIFDVMVFDGSVARPLSFPVPLEASSLTRVLTQQRVLVQYTNSALYSDNIYGTWTSCHIPLMVENSVVGILNVASECALSEMEVMVPIFRSVGQFLSHTFTRINHQEQAAILLDSQAKQNWDNEVRLIDDKSDERLSVAKRNPFALLFVNLDEFRVIPEAQPRVLSPEVRAKWGDRLQEHVTHSLNTQLREGDMISRVGSTEFVIALRSDPFLNVPSVASRIANLFDQPIFLGDQGFCVSCSIGISFYPEDGRTANELIKKADVAMHEAKAQGIGNVKLYRSEVSDAISRRLQIEQGLTHPDVNQQLEIVFQPQWDCCNEQLYGFECLVRWNHPDLGFISPAEFIPIAEELGCIQTITHLSLTQALRLTRYILDTHDLILRPSVNVSALEFEGMQALYDMTDQLLHDYQLPGDVLTLELTESVFLKQSETIITQMQRFQDRGIQISLDDFGTGFSSLNYLLDLPLNTLKIDRAFVQNLDRDPKRRGVVKAIAAMAKSLEMRCIAEGVETHAELDCLEGLGCRLIQGHIVAPALAVDSFLDFIAVSHAQTSIHSSP